MTDEISLQSENIRRVLEVERRMEGGCAALLDKDQTLLREGQKTHTHTHNVINTLCITSIYSAQETIKNCCTTCFVNDII